MIGPARGGSRDRAREYGCGDFGVALHTGTPGLVCKITSDMREARFVAAALSLGEWPSGLVRHHAVVKLDGLREGRPIYALWREEIQAPGELPKGSDLLAGRLDAFHALARVIGYDLNRLRSGLQGKDLAASLRWGDFFAEPATKHDFLSERQALAVLVRETGVSGPVPRLGFCFKGCKAIAERIASRRVGCLVGEAMEFYLERGMLLADVHEGNVGHGHRRKRGDSLLITDPGMVVGFSGVFDRDLTAFEPRHIATATSSDWHEWKGSR